MQPDLAREAADEAMAKDPTRPRFVAGAIGPTNRTASLSPDVNDPALRNVTFDQLVRLTTNKSNPLFKEEWTYFYQKPLLIPSI